MIVGRVLASGDKVPGPVAWVRVLAFSASAKLKLGSQGSNPIALVLHGGYVAPADEPWDEISAVDASITVELGTPRDPYPGPPVKP